MVCSCSVLNRCAFRWLLEFEVGWFDLLVWFLGSKPEHRPVPWAVRKTLGSSNHCVKSKLIFLVHLKLFQSPLALNFIFCQSPVSLPECNVHRSLANPYTDNACK